MGTFTNIFLIKPESLMQIISKNVFFKVLKIWMADSLNVNRIKWSTNVPCIYEQNCKWWMRIGLGVVVYA